MFAALDEVDWASMEHAYGPAVEVPGLIRGLVSADPRVREVALDGMYGAVHHQGDVYECTLHAIPFLLEAAASDAPGRAGVLRLLASIGGEKRDDDGDVPPGSRYAAARDGVAAAHWMYVRLLADDDPEVRAAAAEAMPTSRHEAADTLAALRGRWADEDDPEVRATLLTVAGRLCRRTGWVSGLDAHATYGWLVGVATGEDRPALRLAALAELVRSAPDRLPADVVGLAVDLHARVYAGDATESRPAGFSTDTLTGQLRELRERDAADRRAPKATELVSDLSEALGDRVAERIELLTALLCAPDWERRFDALRPARRLIDRWRGPYEDLVRLVGERLLDPNPRVSPAAASVLEYLGDLAAPAAGALVQALAAAPREAPPSRNAGPPAWITLWPDGGAMVGPTLRALAELRDPRALRAVEWALEYGDMPSDVGSVIGCYGPAAARLVQAIRFRLRDLPATSHHDNRRSGLTSALGRIGPAASSALPELLALLPEASAVRAVGELGPAAAPAVPALRPLLDHADWETALPAAGALWRITADPDLVLPVLARYLPEQGGGTNHQHATIQAAGMLADLGPAGVALVPRLRPLLAAPVLWVRLHAAVALWTVTGDTGSALPVLTDAWAENRHARCTVARCLAAIGPAAASAVSLPRAELAEPRRHNAAATGWSSSQVRDDEELMRACSEALAALAATGPSSAP